MVCHTRRAQARGAGATSCLVSSFPSCVQAPSPGWPAYASRNLSERSSLHRQRAVLPHTPPFDLFDRRPSASLTRLCAARACLLASPSGPRLCRVAVRNPVLIFHVIPVGMCPRQACLTIPAGRQIRAVLQVQERAKGRILPSLGRHRITIIMFFIFAHGQSDTNRALWEEGVFFYARPFFL